MEAQEDKERLRNNDDNQFDLADDSPTKEDYPESPEQSPLDIQDRHDGLSLCAAIFFVVGAVVGAGLVALPYAMKVSNWGGIPMFFISSMTMCYSGYVLAKACGRIFSDRKPGERIRDPYPLLAEKALGNTARCVVVFTLNIALILTSIVFILLAGEICNSLIPLPMISTVHRTRLRIWFVLCGIFLLPLSLFGSPRDFWGIAIIATVSSVIAAVLMLSNIIMTSVYGFTRTPPPSVNFEAIFAAFGRIMFGFGGTLIFPNIQADLEKPEKFVKAVTIGYSIVTFIYLLLPITAFVVLGGFIKEDLLTTFTQLPLYTSSTFFKTMTSSAQALICGHILSAFIININPVEQHMENLLNIPTNFCWQRVVNRTLTMVFIVIVAVMVPNFGPVLSFVGGSFQALLGIIFPILFYAKLEPNLPWFKEVLLSLVILVAAFGSFGNSYVELRNIMDVITDKYAEA